jgi:dinuclear metal center YbgI/SA1388 family protein
MKIASLVEILEDFAPLSLQESYDNSGLIIGNPGEEVKNALICLDITEEIIDEAIENDFEMIISHHPIIFKGVLKINQKNSVERIIVKAIKNNIAIYAIHTNADNVLAGVNGLIAEKLGLINTSVLDAKKHLFRKLVTFCPNDSVNEVRNSLIESGAGQIGDYDSCTFNTEGTGTFKANEAAKPFVGEKGKLHYEPEIRIETIYPIFKERAIIKALLSAHPYEEVAYDIFPLENQFKEYGSGLLGELKSEMNELNFLNQLKETFDVEVIRHSDLLGKPIKKIALCGGSGSFLIRKAISSGADIFITGDVKYHDFFEAEKKMIIADIGHYESEQFTKDLIRSILIKKIPNFALQISIHNTNPINYFK